MVVTNLIPEGATIAMEAMYEPLICGEADHRMDD